MTISIPSEMEKHVRERAGAAVNEGLLQAERGETRPAEAVFAEFRKNVLPR
jgi:hypothetical protein